jgi:hypothetical protein
LSREVDECMSLKHGIKLWGNDREERELED